VKNQQHGFTLIEVLLSLLVISIIFIGIMSIYIQQTKSLQKIRDTVATRWLKQEILASHQVGLVLLPKNEKPLAAETTLLGQTWSWQAWISQTDSKNLALMQFSVHKKNKENTNE
jgi:type II secretion system protein I